MHPKESLDKISSETLLHTSSPDIGSRSYFDIFIIGGGSGGIALAKEAAQLGAIVGIADYVKPTPKGTKWDLGGTCVNVGCIPKKLMHYASLCANSIYDQKDSDWNSSEKINQSWIKMQTSVANHIKTLNAGYKTQLQDNGIIYFNYLASFVDRNTILVPLFISKCNQKYVSYKIQT